MGLVQLFVGSTKKYAEGWDKIFGDKPQQQSEQKQECDKEAAVKSEKE